MAHKGADTVLRRKKVLMADMEKTLKPGWMIATLRKLKLGREYAAEQREKKREARRQQRTVSRSLGRGAFDDEDFDDAGNVLLDDDDGDVYEADLRPSRTLDQPEKSSGKRVDRRRSMSDAAMDKKWRSCIRQQAWIESR